MTPDDPRHGSYAGGRVHRADNEDLCEPCRRAEARYEQERQLDITHGRPELARSFHYEQQLADGQLTIETGDDIEPKVADVLKAGAIHRPHPYLASTLSTDDTEHGPVCDVCGQIEAAGVHQQEPADDPVDDELDLDGDTDEADADDEGADPWEYDQPEPTTAAEASPHTTPFAVP